MENRYVLQFILNSISKIEKIILKNNVNLMSYKEFITVSHQNSQLIAYSNLVLKDVDKKITDDFILNHFRT